MTRPTWDEIHFTSAILWAQRSRDPSSQVGCAIVSEDNVPLSYGYNGPVRGVEFSDQELKDMPRDEKLMYFEHGERNAIYNAQRTGANLKGATLYIIGTPCCDCCRAIIQSGIKCVKVLKSTGDIWARRSTWSKSMEASELMLEAADVKLEVVDANIWGDYDILIGGTEYRLFHGNITKYPEMRTF
jgi:dCMP deaminase